jgi:hypothetical protein
MAGSPNKRKFEIGALVKAPKSRNEYYNKESVLNHSIRSLCVCYSIEVSIIRDL